jgi:hypothetical protein
MHHPPAQLLHPFARLRPYTTSRSVPRAGKSVVLGLLTLCTFTPQVSAAPAPPFSPDRLPYRLTWGRDTVIAERVHSDEGGRQVRITDAHGRTLRRVAGDWVEDVRLVTPLVAREQGLLVETVSGNGGLADFDGFGAGARPRFTISGAVRADVKDLDGDGTGEVVVTYRFEDVDGGGEHHGTLATVVYAWDGAGYAEATRRFPKAARARAQEYKEQELALERGHTSPTEGDGHQNALLGYFANATLAGDGAAARAWLSGRPPVWHGHLSPDTAKEMADDLHSWIAPLPTQ